ncbi:prolipoprotein diacylglyceryl transferase family protein [Carboxylicivirga linearis]|uniref:Prolipoprotein diacylglyceryl transferase n=1 Tax=Carboxylicivirga linearis TaxID=1628157 RepID=A0ABS5K070_9BACT|nr:prolipoprotein diacylglyceryl transferase family protein [Carboxylicivirga linearis]MBS2100560.1 prolipoprotein diacylglyceryl transferase [Carboxylicivirga linearis]
MNVLFIHLQGNKAAIFSLTFLTAFIVLAIVYIVSGRKSKLNIHSTNLIALTFITSFIIGMKLGSGESFTESVNIFLSPPESVLNGKNGAFGFLLTIPIILLALYVLKLPKNYLEPFAYALPSAVIVQRFGCLFEGCCHGTITNFPIAIQYGSNSAAFHYHQTENLINQYAECSLAIHPVPIYYIIAGILTMVIIISIRKRLNRNGSLLLTSALSLIFFRFIIEFFREPYTNGYTGEIVYGLKIIQWTAIGLTMILGSVLFIREYKTPQKHELPINIFYAYRSFSWFAFLLVAIFYFNSIFTPLEKLVLQIFFTYVGILLFFKLSTIIVQHKLKVVYLSTVFILLFTMGQSSEENSKKPKRMITDKFTSTDLYHAGGNLDYTYYIGGSEGCMGDPGTKMKSQSKFYGGGVRFNFNTLYEGDRRNVFLLQANILPAKENLNNSYNSKLFYSTSFGGRYHWPNFGIGYGATIGTTTGDDGLSTGIMPYLGLRIGPQKIFYFDTGISDFTINPFPLPTYHAGIGSHFGRNDDAGIRVGYYPEGYYSLISIPIKDKIAFNFQYHKFSFDNISNADLYKVGISIKLPNKSINAR